MHPCERVDGPAARWSARLAEEVTALVVLSEPLAEIVAEFVAVGLLKRGCRRNAMRAVAGDAS
jgi:hypothetical protein